MFIDFAINEDIFENIFGIDLNMSKKGAMVVTMNDDWYIGYRSWC